MELRRCDLRAHGGVVQQPGSRRHRRAQLPLAPEPRRRRAALRRARAEARGASGHHGAGDHDRQRLRRCRRRWCRVREALRRPALASGPSRHRPQRSAGGSRGVREGHHRFGEIDMKQAAKLLVIALVTATLAVVGVSFAGDPDEVRGMNSQSFAGATGWLKSPPLSKHARRGKVVVVQFWTFTCINWLRTESHVRAWAERYRDNGLVVIGVHSPEFPFEHDVENVKRAVKGMRIDYPVAIDNNFGVWQAFNNDYWPALYVADANGRIRFSHFGEGKYEETEKVIRQLLADAGHPVTDPRPTAAEGKGVEAQAAWADLGTPETYVGRGRTQGFASEGGSGHYSIPAKLPPNHWALGGEWSISEGKVVSTAGGGRVAFRFHARDLHLVMGPGMQGARTRFRVTIDGQPPGASHGGDIDEQGNGAATEPRLYQLIRQTGPVTDRTFEIEFLDPGAQLFSFTFG